MHSYRFYTLYIDGRSFTSSTMYTGLSIYFGYQLPLLFSEILSSVLLSLIQFKQVHGVRPLLFLFLHHSRIYVFESLTCTNLLISTLFNNPTTLHNHDFIHMLQIVESVCDEYS